MPESKKTLTKVLAEYEDVCQRVRKMTRPEALLDPKTAPILQVVAALERQMEKNHG